LLQFGQEYVTFRESEGIKMKIHGIMETLHDVSDCIKYPTMTKKEQASTAIGFWTFAGPFYIIALAFDKKERESVALIAQFHREIAGKQETMTNEQYWTERIGYCREKAAEKLALDKMTH
jgi:hypothetical protein